MTVHGRPARVLRWNRSTAYVRFLDSLTDDLVPRLAVRR